MKTPAKQTTRSSTLKRAHVAGTSAVHGSHVYNSPKMDLFQAFRRPSCGAQSLPAAGLSRLLRSPPKPAESRLPAELPAPLLPAVYEKPETGLAARDWAEMMKRKDSD
jgi:hypothetical protein